MNIELLTRVAETIVQRAEQFDMCFWYETHTGVPMCGTTACIAGWGIALKGNLTPLEAARIFDSNFGQRGVLRDVVNSHGDNVIAKASAAFDINLSEAQRLFFVSNWPESFKLDYMDGYKRARQALVAKARIEHFIETQGEQ
jgi:hypothetical protein